MGKLKEVDIPVVVSLLQEGERFGEIAEALEVSGPTLRKFMLDNDLYKFSTNKNSLKISRSTSKSNNDNTLKAMIDEVMDHQNDLYDEDVEFLEKLLKKGTSIGKIARMYHRSRTTVRDYLKKIKLYDKYCEGNKFENAAAKKHADKVKKIKDSENKNNFNNISVRPKYGKSVVTESKTEIIEDKHVEETPIENKIESVENKTVESINIFNGDCVVNDVVLNYINKNMKKISMDARLEDLNNTLMDKIISNFSEEELKDSEIKTNIKRTLVRLVEDLL